MYKYLSNLVVLLSLIVVLSAGCTPASEETGSTTEAEVPAETTEASEITMVQDAISDGVEKAAEQVEEGACIVTPPEEPVACTMQYDPVCGCDGKTYPNACSARGAGVPSSTPGTCENGRHD